MAALGSTHVGRHGPAVRSKRKAVGPAPAVMRPVKRIGSRSYLHYDPVTGRKKTKAGAA